MKIVTDSFTDALTSKAQCEGRKAPAEYHIIGSQRRIPGHTLFAYNQKTREWKVADLRRDVEVDVNGKPVYKNAVSIHPHTIYVQALNLENAKKKYMKMLRRHLDNLRGTK